MTPAGGLDQASIPLPSCQRTLATALHLDALPLGTHLDLLALCRLAVQLAHRQCPPPLPAGPGGASRASGRGGPPDARAAVAHEVVSANNEREA